MGMKLELEFYKCLCATNVFVINGVIADSDEFGEGYDREPDLAEEDGCCGQMQFTRHEETNKQALKKYNITEDEYDEICERLESGLSFGYCGWCS